MPTGALPAYAATSSPLLSPRACARPSSHQAQRERDPPQAGSSPASTGDYEPVRDLVAALIAEGVEASVRFATRETVEAVRAA